jgi:hypothetical protein
MASSEQPLIPQAGMIDTENIERRKRKNAWAKRYDERNLESAHIGQALEDGEEGDNYVPESEAERIRLERRQREGLWGDDDAQYYNEGMSMFMTKRVTTCRTRLIW